MRARLLKRNQAAAQEVSGMEMLRQGSMAGDVFALRRCEPFAGSQRGVPVQPQQPRCNCTGGHFTDP